MNRNHFVIALFIVLAGCGGGDSSLDTRALCEHPVELSNENKGAMGFLVGIDKEQDVSTVATAFLEKYDNLEVFWVDSVCNCFNADSSETILARLACEPSVVSLQYNNAVPAAAK
jgi:hypothetical protein